MPLNETQQVPVVIVTGCSGLIGTQLTAALLDRYRVVGMDLHAPGKDVRLTEWIPCDLTNDDDVAKALKRFEGTYGPQVASVVHLAAYYDFSGRPSPLYRELTVEGTRRLLEQLRQLEVEQFVFSSSLLVMRPPVFDEPLTADAPTQAEWDYPQSKLDAEAVIEEEHGAIPVMILRIAGVYDEDCRSIPIAQQISRIHNKQLESYVFPGDVTHGQAFVHLDDLVDCFCRTIDKRRELPPYETLLIGEEDVMSYAELQRELGNLIHGEAWPAIPISKTIAKAGAWVKEKFASDDRAPFIKPWMIDLADQHYPVDIARARQLLAWEPRHTLRDTLPEMIRRLHEDPRRWYRINGIPLPDKLPETQHAEAES